MERGPLTSIRWLFDSERGAFDRLIPRWIFLRALGLIYFSAFFSLVFQIRGLIGPQGILPAADFLPAVAHEFPGNYRFWFAPTLLWYSASSHMLIFLCWAGMIASLLAVINFWPRVSLFICFVCFLSFVAAAREFSGYQSDGMLLEAGFLALFFAPAGFRPGWGESSPPSRASMWLLQWEWFRIYFESGYVKLASGDPQWRHLTAIIDYYQNGPLPTWIGWYAAHLPRAVHVGTAALTLALELVIVWMLFLPRKFRIILFLIVTPWELAIILTANYTFLNYLVLFLGFLLLDDKFLTRYLPRWMKKPDPSLAPAQLEPASLESKKIEYKKKASWSSLPERFTRFQLSVVIVVLFWIFYATTARLIWLFIPSAPIPTSPVAALEPFRIANQYGLFARMTPNRYEIEFQGSNDGQNWTTYQFRFKPQDIDKAPRIYAPYQPRFDWNLWFASLAPWNESSIVPRTEGRLLTNDPDVLRLFASNPFPNAPPKQVRAIIWQYWFSSEAEKHAQSVWWRRQLLGPYAPTIEMEGDGKIGVIAFPPPGFPPNSN
jgi:lipase maturation factor 1